MASDERAAATETTADRIARAALHRFSASGFSGTSMRDIAGDVGVTTAALYYHYPGKDALLAAVVDPYLGACEAMLDESRSSTATQLLGRFLDLVLADRDVVGFLERDVGASHHPLVAPRLDAITGRLRLGLLSEPDHDEADLVRVSAVLGAVIRPVLRFPAPDRFRDVILQTATRLLA